MLRLVVAILIFTACCACKPSNAPSTSFYYWKTNFQLSPEERNVLIENHVERLYVRYCDVVLKNNMAIPESPIVFSEQPKGFVIIPVIYIKNEVMLKSALDVSDLADNIISFVDQINKKISAHTSELQIDCDWSEESKDKYFRLLELISERSKWVVSVTIRLHQVKYRERTGVPPVKKGVLMYYNMGRIAADQSNSIYERSIAIRYLDRLNEYPLPLNIALPIFGWGVHIRNQQVIGLLRDVDAEAFRHDSHFEMLTEPFFETKTSTFKGGHRFQAGDRIKIESVRSEDLEEMVHDINEKIKNTPTEVIFYDLDNFNLRTFQHDHPIFEKISSDF